MLCVPNGHDGNKSIYLIYSGTSTLRRQQVHGMVVTPHSTAVVAMVVMMPYSLLPGRPVVQATSCTSFSLEQLTGNCPQVCRHTYGVALGENNMASLY